mgnify:CR=1 FL=1
MLTPYCASYYPSNQNLSAPKGEKAGVLRDDIHEVGSARKYCTEFQSEYTATVEADKGARSDGA